MNPLRKQFDHLCALAACCGIGQVILRPSRFTERWEIELGNGQKFHSKFQDGVMNQVETYLNGYSDGRQFVLDTIFGESDD